VVSFTPLQLYLQGKSPRYTLDRRLSGPQSRSGDGVEEKNSQPTPGFEPRSSNCPARSQSLYRLSYADCKYIILLIVECTYEAHEVDVIKHMSDFKCLDYHVFHNCYKVKVRAYMSFSICTVEF
jgi:hypothetical protein